MGPGILTRYSRQVLGGFLALFVLVAAVLLYLRFRSPVGGESPYDDIFDQGKYGIEITADEVMYTGQTAPVRVTIRNTAESGWIVPETVRPLEWVLETRVNGVWHSMRTLEKRIAWDFPEEDKSPNGGPSGIVKEREEQTFLCYVGDYYRLPLKPGSYRIVFPAMTKELIPGSTAYGSLAAEFEVLP